MQDCLCFSAVTHVNVCVLCSDYAKHVAVRIERIGLLVHICLLGTDVHIVDEVSSAMNRGCLFALSITGVQSSPTLYILHGEPEGPASQT